jgi:hypothetical protein
MLFLRHEIFDNMLCSMGKLVYCKASSNALVTQTISKNNGLQVTKPEIPDAVNLPHLFQLQSALIGHS